MSQAFISNHEEVLALQLGVVSTGILFAVLIQAGNEGVGRMVAAGFFFAALVSAPTILLGSLPVLGKVWRKTPRPRFWRLRSPGFLLLHVYALLVFAVMQHFAGRAAGPAVGGFIKAVSFIPLASVALAWKLSYRPVQKGGFEE